MSLQSWQAALLKILPDPENASHVLAQQTGQLTRQELDQLTIFSSSTGLDVTRDVQLWWRKARLQIAIPFSMRLIERLELRHLVAQYQKRPCTTLFFLREAQAFRDFIQESPEAPILLRDMVQFECALHLARLRQSGTGAQPTAEFSPHSATLELPLSHCPEACMAALLQNTSLPDPTLGGVTIQINSDWPRLWRKGSPAK